MRRPVINIPYGELPITSIAVHPLLTRFSNYLVNNVFLIYIFFLKSNYCWKYAW